MTIIDFIIGVTLMNAMPHFVGGIWQARMLSGFGFGNVQNILYALLNFSISFGLFVYKYGINMLFENGIYLGAVVVLLIFFLTGKLQYRTYHKNM